MTRFTPTRNASTIDRRDKAARAGTRLYATIWGLAVCGLAMAVPPAVAGPVHSHFQQSSRPAPIVRSAPPQTPPQAPPRTDRPSAEGANGFTSRPGRNQEHLAQWMQSHSGLSLEEQQRALQAEPGFSRLDPQVQARMHQRLAQLNGMSPAQRQHTIQRAEDMEALKPEQRLQVRNALVSLGGLPEDRRRLVGRTFRSLRALPDPQRQAYLNSPAVRSQFSDQERMVLNNLFAVSPYLPPPPPAPVVPAAPQAPR